ncbi:MAG TPA: cytidylate kinase family protein [Thermoplasmata archaeon]|nr:cytidylate kinase family protein [Thermoplasmata archaeon]
MIRRVVAVGGPPGSGKSTAGHLVAEALGLEFRSAGEEFRRQGRERGMDVEAFGRYAESHPEVDRELDRAMQALATPGRLIEARLAGPLCRRNGIPVHSVIVTASEEERTRRVARRDGQTVEEARERIRAREASERGRYLRLYGIDIDREIPDLSVDSTMPPPKEVAAVIIAFLRSHTPGPDP